MAPYIITNGNVIWLNEARYRRTQDGIDHINQQCGRKAYAIAREVGLSSGLLSVFCTDTAIGKTKQIASLRIGTAIGTPLSIAPITHLYAAYQSGLYAYVSPDGAAYYIGTRFGTKSIVSVYATRTDSVPAVSYLLTAMNQFVTRLAELSNIIAA